MGIIIIVFPRWIASDLSDCFGDLTGKAKKNSALPDCKSDRAENVCDSHRKLDVKVVSLRRTYHFPDKLFDLFCFIDVMYSTFAC